MAMFKSASGGGGFLHGVSGVINSVKFSTKEWPAKPGKQGYSTLSADLLITPDGADKPKQQFIPAGFFYPETQSISPDGKTLISTEKGAIIRENTEFAQFVGDAIKAGMDLTEDNTQGGKNFEIMEGYRVTFAKVANVEAQIAAGKKALGAKAKTATEAEIMTAGKRADKNDPKKAYNRDSLTISAVLGAPVAKAGGAKKATNGSGKAIVAAPIDNKAAELALKSILVANDGTVEVKSLKSLLTVYVLENSLPKAEREGLMKVVPTADFLASVEGVDYDADAKTVTLA